VGYWQNHDQIGNRVRGRRSGQLVSPERLAVGAALVLTAPFVPLLFQGEEWGASAPFLYFTSHEDQTLGAAVREGRRREFAAFGWDPDAVPDPQAPETFERSKLDWRELEREPHASLLAWHRRLIDLRRTWPALTDGRLDAVRVRVDETARWLAVDRGPVTVACNLAAEPQHVPVGTDARRLVLTSQPNTRTTATGVTLPPDAVAILAPERG
jgi:maltooligosyltrehalose trehalohydrolase